MSEPTKPGTYIIPTTPTSPAIIVGESGHIHIHSRADAKCEDCGQLAELRPYGKNGANVCFDCGMKDEANAKKLFARQFK